MSARIHRCAWYVGGVLMLAAGSSRGVEIPSKLKPTFIVPGGETIVASAVVTEAPYRADGTGARDATGAIQEAIDAVSTRNGGVVFLPAGRYRIDGRLRIAYGTTLVGQPRRAGQSGVGEATVLLAYAGRGDASGPPLIDAAFETGLMNLTIWHPEQSPDDVQPYPFTIVGNGGVRVRNVLLCNAYNGILLRQSNASVVENVEGTVLNRGLVAPESFEFSWMHDVQFANRFWPEAVRELTGKGFTAGQAGALDSFTKKHLVGLELGRLDGLAVYRYGAVDAKTAILVRKNESVNQHRVHGFGGVVAEFRGPREDSGWDPWYYGMHYANVDNVPEASGKTYTFAEIPIPLRTDPGSFIDVTQPPYSAAGDGRKDDTAAIDSALTAAGDAGGGTVYLPQGEYRITQPLVVPRGVELRGPLGTGKVRQYRETCSLAAYCGRGTRNPETDPALLTLTDHAGVRGLNIVYPEQPYDVGKLQSFPYSIRGRGRGVWIVDVHLLNSYNGIDLATHRCDDHTVAGLWGTVFHKGIRVGGNSHGGKLERLAFSYGPWTEAGRVAGVKTPEGKKAIAEFCRLHNVHYTFSDCVGETAWGLVGFYPHVHYHFEAGEGRGCVDAELWLSMHDVADRTNLQVDRGENICLIGYFGTGGQDKRHNWLEVAEDFRGPLNVYAKTIQQTFLNHPMRFRPSQVRFYDEVSLTTGRPATASHTGPESSAANAVDRDPRTIWRAPPGSWLEVDLGSVKTINRFAVETAGLFAEGKPGPLEAELHASTDGKTFTPAATLGTLGFAWADMPVPPVPARYVQLRVKDGDDHGTGIATFDVFGKE